MLIKFQTALMLCFTKKEPFFNAQKKDRLLTIIGSLF